MNQKKYEMDVSSCNNFYINIIKELGTQDIIDIKKIYPEISLYDLFNTIELINEVFREEGLTDFIFFSQIDKEHSHQAEYLSNNCYISINKDETLANIKINPDGNSDKLQKEINKTGIIYGLMTEIVDYIVANKILDPFVFAKGDFPVPVKEANYTYFYETKRPFPVNLQQGTKGVYLDTTIENRTILGKKIATITKSSKGIPGKTITGLTIPTKIQPRKNLTLGENVIENGSTILPKINGVIDYSSEIIEVIPTLIIKEPVFNQNIEFDGTIIIENMVQNSTVKATHDITIYGTSNSATLEAEGYIYILTGFTGNSSKATARKGIFCGYAHNSKLTTIEGDINIGYESLHAKLTSGKSIYVEKKVSGGRLSAKENIYMDSSGSERITSKTELTLNYDTNKKTITMTDLIQEIQTTERKYQNATKELTRFEISSEKSKSLLIKDSSFQQLTSIVYELQEQIKGQLLSLSKNKDSNEETPEPQKTGLIVIKDKAWNGTAITINHESFFVDKNANQGSTFRLGNYGIIRERYEKEDII
jgi:uncharacterized protein (DUF342 family)